MCLSIYDLPPADLQNKRSFFVNTLKETTLFGSSAMFKQSEEHPVMDHPLFFEMPLLTAMHAKAWKQLGSSGSGNHFVEFGIVDLPAEDTQLGLQAGSYLGVLSHSGSRALGAKVAQYYTNVAISKRRLAQEMKQLAWLYLDEDAGAEYWAAMNLAGDYATACHQVIHNKISKLLGRRPVSIVENHHNFAWKENWQGREVIVHRKGATPAGAGVMGIIPGSMASPGFIVRGKGFAPALHSASHGAGRLMSRSKARDSITSAQMQKLLQQHDITLLGGGIDEAPFAYKDIHTVMQQQTELVDVVGSFFPKIVRMADN
jgi:tRNA-splicing ligase RtcB